jgi:hypothetical protein
MIAANSGGVLGWAGPTTGAISHLSRAFTYAALPADESAQTYTPQTGAVPLLWVRG